MWRQFAWILFVSLIAKSAEHPLESTRIGGEPVEPGQFLFYAGIYFKQQFLGTFAHLHICSGSILSERWVLTAALCVHRRQLAIITLLLGGPENDRVSHKVADAVVHPDFKLGPDFYQHNIALIKPEKAIKFNQYVQPIRLSSSEIGDGVHAQVSGWASVPLRKQNGEHEGLTYINVTTILNEDCDDYLEDSERHLLHENIVCVQNAAHQGICIGDSGTGLLSVDDGKLIGIGLWTISCGLGEPDGFTRIHPYLQWISNATEIEYA